MEFIYLRIIIIIFLYWVVLSPFNEFPHYMIQQQENKRRRQQRNGCTLGPILSGLGEWGVRWWASTGGWCQVAQQRDRAKHAFRKGKKKRTPFSGVHRGFLRNQTKACFWKRNRSVWLHWFEIASELVLPTQSNVWSYLANMCHVAQENIQIYILALIWQMSPNKNPKSSNGINTWM